MSWLKQTMPTRAYSLKKQTGKNQLKNDMELPNFFPEKKEKKKI
jgi:hypothetical protein